MADSIDVSARIRDALRRAAAQLQAGGVPDEAHAEFLPARKVLRIFTVAPTMRQLGRVWRLGVILLDADGNAYATGATARAQTTGRPNHQSLSAETRRAHRSAALKAGYPEGETINFDTTPIDPDALDPRGPIIVHDGEPRVLWVPTATPDAATPLDAYLSERVDLLLNPPEGA